MDGRAWSRLLGPGLLLLLLLGVGAGMQADAMDLDIYYIKGWWIGGYVTDSACAMALWDGIIVYQDGVRLFEYKYGYGKYFNGSILPVTHESRPGIHNVSYIIEVNLGDRILRYSISVDGVAARQGAIQLQSDNMVYAIWGSKQTAWPINYINGNCDINTSNLKYMYVGDFFKIKNAEIVLQPGEERDIYLDVYNPLGRLTGYPVLQVKVIFNKFTSADWVEVDPKYLWKEVAPGIKFSLYHYHAYPLLLEHGVNKLKIKIKADDKDYVENVKLKVRLKLLHVVLHKATGHSALAADVPLYSNVVAATVSSERSIYVYLGLGMVLGVLLVMFRLTGGRGG